MRVAVRAGSKSLLVQPVIGGSFEPCSTSDAIRLAAVRGAQRQGAVLNHLYRGSDTRQPIKPFAGPLMFHDTFGVNRHVMHAV